MNTKNKYLLIILLLIFPILVQALDFPKTNSKIVEIYDYGYTINLLNDGESGLIEDFLNEKQNEATTSDYYNFNLNEEDWIKIVNHGINFLIVIYPRNFMLAAITLQ